jgi:nucleoside-diphosphate-sugar epimerase
VQFGQAVAVALGRKPATVIRVPGPLARLLGYGGDVMSLMRSRAGWVGRDKITEALAGSWTCSAAKARAHLGWSSAAGLAERLSETARWYREAGWL